jgi:predicted  nucleic acid-binding Zn-ribbon protein
MAAEQLQIQVQANVQQAIAGLNSFNKQLEVTGTATELLGTKSIEVLNNQLLRLQRIASQPNLTSEQYQRLGKLINDTSKEADRLTKSLQVLNGANGFQGLSKGANTANTAMINLGRGVSDAPFGFIGIANNIGPLVENFVQLRKESGTTGSALKQLGASLIGPGGVIVGIQLVVAAIQFAQLGFSRWVKSSKEAKEKADEYNDSLKEIRDSLSKEFSQVSALVNALRNITLTRQEQNEAIKKLNQIAPEYFGNIKNETGIVENLANAYFLYSQTLANTFRVKARQKELDKLSNELLKIEEDLIKIEDIAKKTATPKGRVLLTDEKGVTQDILTLTRSRFSLQNKYNDLQKEIGVLTLKDLKLTKDTKTETNKVVDLLKDYKEELAGIRYEGQIKGLNVSNQLLETNLSFLVRAAKLVGQTGQAYKSINADTQKFADAAANQKIVDVITAYQNGLSELDIKQAITGQDQLNARINAATDALVKLKTLGVQDTNEEFIKLQNTLNGLQAEVGLAEIRKRTEEITKVWERFNLQISKLDFNKTKNPLEALKSRIDLIGNAIQDLKSKGLTDKDLGIQLLNVQFEQLGAQFEKLKEQKELFDQLQQTIEGGLTNAFSSVFEAILNGEDAFKALENSVKSLLTELVKVIIRMTILKSLANLIAPGSGAALGKGGELVLRSDTMRGLILGR